MLLAAVENARVARTEAGREDDSYIVLDIGPIGQLLEPMGTLTFDEAYDIIPRAGRNSKRSSRSCTV